MITALLIILAVLVLWLLAGAVVALAIGPVLREGEEEEEGRE